MQKKVEKKFFLSAIIASEDVAIICLTIPVIASQCVNKQS